MYKWVFGQRYANFNGRWYIKFASLWIYICMYDIINKSGKE